MKQKFPVKTEVLVYFADCDLLRHCNNARFFTFMEQARLAYSKKLGELDLRKMSAEDPSGFILAEASCTFKSPAAMDEILIVSVRISKLKTKSFIMEYEIKEKRSRRLIATGQSVQVMYNYRKKKTFPIPPSLRWKIEKLEGGSR